MSEERLYEPTKRALETYYRERGLDAEFWITKDSIPRDVEKRLPDEVLFLMGSREFRPDIMGVIKESLFGFNIILTNKLIVVEVKDEEPTLKDWLQAKNYGDIFNAPIAMLISTHELPERVRRLLDKNISLKERVMSGYRIIFAVLKQINNDKWQLDNFYPEDL